MKLIDEIIEILSSESPNLENALIKTQRKYPQDSQGKVARRFVIPNS